MKNDFSWTPEEIGAYCRRIGLPPASPEASERLRLMAQKVSEAGAAIPRMPKKDMEPAPVIIYPL